MSQPTMYTDALAEEICEAISNTSKGLKELCDENPHWPGPQGIRKWVVSKEKFGAMYARAKQAQADFMVEEILSISDDGSNDYYTDEKGVVRLDGEHVQRSRLRVDSRKWLAAKLAPRAYGEKKEVSVEESLMTKIIDKL